MTQNRIHLALLAVWLVALSGCAGAMVNAPAPTLDPCSATMVNDDLLEMGDYLERFISAADAASATERNQMEPLLAEMLDLIAQVEDETWPRCMDDLRQSMLTYMEAQTAALGAFFLGEPTEGMQENAVAAYDAFIADVNAFTQQAQALEP
ncbi:MAG: hypothetical protein GYB68_17090 [Chloroflexi bacterium]|nr:hypothetical protein [Chloroflexota bacterium]